MAVQDWDDLSPSQRNAAEVVWDVLVQADEDGEALNIDEIVERGGFDATGCAQSTARQKAHQAIRLARWYLVPTEQVNGTHVNIKCDRHTQTYFLNAVYDETDSYTDSNERGIWAQIHTQRLAWEAQEKALPAGTKARKAARMVRTQMSHLEENLELLLEV